MDPFVSVVSVAAFFGLIGFWILAKNFGKIAGSADEDVERIGISKAHI